FEPTLAESEVADARRYWTGVWQAGGIEDQERGAWRGLVAGHGSGRAAWIVATYRPLNTTARPAKPLATDVVLVVPTEAALPAGEAAAAAAFWRATWLADGERAATDAARAALEAAVGAGRAAELVERYRPANLDERPAPPRGKRDVNVQAAFVVFPLPEDVPTTRRTWSRAPTVAAFPDRFVLLAYAGDGPPLVAVGRPVPSPLVAGPDPSAPPAGQLAPVDGDLRVPEEMRWLVDFDRAVEVGMGFRLDLGAAQAQAGFDRLLVLGLRLSADEQAAAAELQTLIEHHRHGRTGFALLPQGTPTNNVEGAGAGFTREEDADASYDELFKRDALLEESADWLEKRDGQWLAECLGLDPAVLARVRHGDGADQREARAMNVALWPATLGYWMETLMDPVFGRDALAETRRFFTRFVSGRGMVPPVRIGSQPYGILPATAFSRMAWMTPLTGAPAPARTPPLAHGPAYLRRLYETLTLLGRDWAGMAATVSFAGKPGDAHQTVLDVLGLHPGSVEFAQRYAEATEQLVNRLRLVRPDGQPAAAVIGRLAQ
ncbi:MAG TPA: hypothetical protein VFX28_05140, partial [Methylomirabilota bacterium]|nr:hypothetical protein [Methylomirabilota bacterium]